MSVTSLLRRKKANRKGLFQSSWCLNSQLTIRASSLNPTFQGITTGLILISHRYYKGTIQLIRTYSSKTIKLCLHWNTGISTPANELKWPNIYFLHCILANFGQYHLTHTKWCYDFVMPCKMIKLSELTYLSPQTLTILFVWWKY